MVLPRDSRIDALRNYGYVFARALSLWGRVAEGRVRAREHSPSQGHRIFCHPQTLLFRLKQEGNI
jgi:hypothetical protein